MSPITLFADFRKCLEETRFDDAVTIACAAILPGPSGRWQEPGWDHLTGWVHPLRIAEGRYIEGCPLLLGCWQAVAKEQREQLHVWSQALQRECLHSARSRLPRSDLHTALAVLACAQAALASMRYDYEHLLRWGWQATHWFAGQEPGAPPADLADLAAGIHWPSQGAYDIVDLSFSALATVSHCPVGRARDLTRWLWRGTKDHDSALRSCALKVPLYNERKAEGMVATLILTLVEGHGELYADPITMAFRAWDGAFNEACQAAWTFIRRNREQQSAWDVRWHLHTTEPMPLKGESLGGAFGVGLQHLLDGTPMDLSTAITATIDAEGQLGPVAYLEEKIKALKRPEEKITRLIVGRDNRIDVKAPAFEPLQIEVTQTVTQASEIASGLIPELTAYLQNLFARLGDLPWFYPHDMPFETVHIPVKVSQERLRYGGEPPGWQGKRSQGIRGLEDPEAYVWRGAEANAAQARSFVVREWEEVRAAVLQRGNHHAVILGDPGFGKTRLLQSEGRRRVQEALKYLEEHGSEGVALPIFARLVDLAAYGGEMEEVLCAFLRREYSLSEALLTWVRRTLSTPDCFLLLDGWDEVPLKERDFEDSASLARRLERFARKAPCYILLTSRITGYRRAPLPLRAGSGHEFELIAFNLDQVDQFIKAWFQGQPDKGKRLLQEFHQSPQLMGLARRPLLLSFICLLFQEREAGLPTRRAALYEECLYGLLQRWHRHPVDRTYVEAKIELLGEVALAVLREGDQLFSLDLIRRKVEAFLNRVAPSHPLYGRTSNDVLAEVIQQDGILIESGPQETAHFLFLHQTFQEYLAAKALAHEENAIAEVRKYLWSSPGWEEVIVLFATMLRDPEDFIKGLLAAPDDLFRSGLCLAGRCAAECEDNNVSRKLIDTIWDEVYKLFDASPYHRQRAHKLLTAMARSSRTCMSRLNDALKGQDLRKALKAWGIFRDLNLSRPELIEPLLDALKSHKSVLFCLEAADVLSSLTWSESLAALYNGQDFPSDDPKAPLRNLLLQQAAFPLDRYNKVFRTLLGSFVFADQTAWGHITSLVYDGLRIATQVRRGHMLTTLLDLFDFVLRLLKLGMACLGGVEFGLMAVIRSTLTKRSFSDIEILRYASGLVSADLWRRLHSVEEIGRFPEDQMLGIFQMVARRDDHPLVREAAANVLIKMGHITPEMILTKLEAIGDKSIHVSQAAMEGLIEPLRSLLHEAMDEISSAATASCTIEEFTQASGTEAVVLQVIAALLQADALPLNRLSSRGLLESPTATLQEILRSNPRIVALLGQVVQKRESTAGQASSRDALQVDDPPGYPPLPSPSLQEGTYVWARMKGIEALENSRGPASQVLEALIEIIRHDRNIWVCTKAIKSLLQFTPLAPQILTKFLQTYLDESDEVSERVIEALGHIGDAAHPDATETLIRVVQQDPSAQVRLAAIRVLQSFGRADSKIVPILCQLLGDADDQIRREAASALGECGDADTLEDLCQLWGKIPQGKREEILFALEPLGLRFKRKIWQQGLHRRLSCRPIA